MKEKRMRLAVCFKSSACFLQKYPFYVFMRAHLLYAGEKDAKSRGNFWLRIILLRQWRTVGNRCKLDGRLAFLTTSAMLIT